MQPTITDVAERQRFEARLDGEVVGYAAYLVSGSALTLTHTVVEPAVEGRGIGSALVRAALGDARRRGLGVVPRCPFVQAFVDRHDEYADLV